MKKNEIWEDKMKPMSEQKVCASCGAPAISELCSYCGMPTGIESWNAGSEYPMAECNPAHIGDARFATFLAVGLVFSLCGLWVIVMPGGGIDGLIMKAGGVIFFLLGFFVVIKPVKRIISYIKVKTKGKRISGKVYGYVLSPWGTKLQEEYVAKILIETPRGPRFILYDLGKNYKPYSINEPIALLAYKNNYLIAKNYYFDE